MVRVAPLFLLLALATGAPLPSTPAPSLAGSCKDIRAFHLLDFWLGDWEVYVGKTLAGRDRVYSTLEGCAVIEEWTGQTHVAAKHDQGMSLFYYDAFDDAWTQVWVTNNAAHLGGLKVKHFWGAPGKSVRFQGPLPGRSHGHIVLDRTTLTPLPGRRVHQVIEFSSDGGQTWRKSFDALYVRRL
jgi:hypothetical protein